MIWFMPADRWRRLERSRSSASCRWASAWSPVIRDSVRFASDDSRRLPGVNTEELVELVTTPRARVSRRSNGPIRTSSILRDANTGIDLIGWDRRSRARSRFRPRQGEACGASTMFVSANYFKTLGVALARGAGFDASTDDPLRAEPVVILGYRFWQNQLGADSGHRRQDAHDGWHPACRGRCCAGSIWRSPGCSQAGSLFVPLEQHPLLPPGPPPRRGNVRSDRAQGVAAHSRPAVARRQRSAGERGGCRRHRAVGQSVSGDQRVQGRHRRGVRPARHSRSVPNFRIVQTVALTLTGMVLLVVCLNISGMMQVRSAMRERELSIRQAIGASRGRLAQYLLSEAIVLACAGGALASIVLFNIPVAAVLVDRRSASAADSRRRCRVDVSDASRSVSACASSPAWCSDGCRPCVSVVR